MRKTYLLFLITSLLLTGLGCKKASEAERPRKQTLVESTKKYFDQYVSPGALIPLPADTGKKNRNPRMTLQKTAVWDQAYVTRLSTGDAVVVPVLFRNPFLIKSNFGGSNNLYSINDLVKLLIYQDTNRRYHAEVVTYLPDSNYISQINQPFSGIAVVEDWSGNELNKFRYLPNGKIKKYNSALAKQDAESLARTNNEPSTDKFIQLYYEVYGYNYSPDDPNNGYYWSEIYGGGTYFIDDNGWAANGINATDYGITGGGSASGNASENQRIKVAKTVSILPGNNSIANFKEYIKCFDNAPRKDYSYQVSVCVSQPSSGSRDAWSFSDADGSSKAGNMFFVGHTFLVLSESTPAKTIVRNVGFYPKNDVTPYSPSSQGALNNDEMHNYNISLTINLTNNEFTSLLNYIAEAGTKGYTYNLNTNNCTTFALNALSSIDIDLPRTSGKWLNGGGNDPGDLGEDIRQMKLSSNMTRNVNEMAHNNKGTCN